ncbi:hypothetical protein HJ127_04910 [Vibrio parahaemolyticus]|nr:hypothetical protein [Vibrio parahaemolyticus]
MKKQPLASKKDKGKLIDNYVNFLEAEFSVRFDIILSDLRQKASDQAAREIAITQAKSNIKEINTIKQQLEAILQVNTKTESQGRMCAEAEAIEATV